MNFQNMHLVCSAPSMQFWPEVTHNEIVLAGRSNVGKSSLINTLCNQRQMAYVGNTAGKTKMLNFFDVDNTFTLVDVPGYGFANASQKLLIQFGEMMEDYFSSDRPIKGVIVLLDARHKPTNDDLVMLDFARDNHFPVLCVVTKVDKCGYNELQKNLKKISETINVNISDLILFSSKTKKGRDQLIEKIENLLN